MYYFMDIFYAIGMNITKKACVKHGQTDDTGKKFAKFGEVIEKMKLAAAEPDNSGNYHDYVELCKLYDKNENGTMMLAELENILSNLGEKFGVKICKYPVFRKLSLLAYNQIIIDNQMVPF